MIKPHDFRQAAGTPPADSACPDEQDPQAAFPFIALTIQSTGIHPATSRLITLDAVTLSESGEHGEEFHVVFNPDGDCGPRHQHGLTPEEVAEGRPFSGVLKTLDELIDGRTLILHDTSYTWGFVVSEARRAMTAAARQNRARNRGRNRNRRRRQKVGHIPNPAAIIDTLATARRQAVQLTDIRLNAVALAYGLDVEAPQATPQRAGRPEAETSREATLNLIALAAAQRARGNLATMDPEKLRADRFGLQRSMIRNEAINAPRMHHNPGTYQPGKELIRGMEIVVAPDIEMDPDVIIEALVKAELNYVEKLSRESSLVVCNVTTDLVGKPMHAVRKNIPLMSDVAFMEALERIQDAIPAPEKKEREGKHVPNSNNRSARRRSSTGSSKSGSGTKPGQKSGHKSGQRPAHGSGGGAKDPSEGSAKGNAKNKPKNANGDGGRNSGKKNQRRRGGRGRRRRNSSGNGRGNGNS